MPSALNKFLLNITLSEYSQENGLVFNLNWLDVFSTKLINLPKYTSGLPYGANPIILYSPSLGLNPKYAVIVEYTNPKELGYLIDCIFCTLPFLLLYTAVVSHSPTPSTVSIAGFS